MKKVIFLALSIFTMNTYAAGTWYFGLALKDVTAQNKANQTAFQTIEAVKNPMGCPNTDYYGVRSENNPQLAMSVLLVAYMGNKKIDIYVDDDVCDAFGRPSVTDIRIRN